MEPNESVVSVVGEGDVSSSLFPYLLLLLILLPFPGWEKVEGIGRQRNSGEGGRVQPKSGGMGEAKADALSGKRFSVWHTIGFQEVLKRPCSQIED